MPQSRFTFRIWGCEDGDHLPIGDYSITLPAAVAFFSAWTGRPVPAGWVLTGNIDPQTGQLIPVGSLREKLAALSTELQGWFKMLIVPASAETADYPRNAEHLLPVRTLPEALDLLWGATWQKVNPEKLDLAGALEDATAEYYTGNNQAALLAFDRIAILCGQKGQMRRIKYHALWRRGSCDTHLGNINIAKLSIEKAHKLGRQLLSEKIILPDDYYGCLTSNAICLDDAYDFANAAAAINEVIRHLLKARATPEALGRAMGTRALISLHLRRLADAECSCLRSITAFKTFGKMAELSRSYCWLAIVRGERGDLEGADRAFNKAKEYAGILSPAAFQSQYFAYADARISVRTHRYRRCVRRTADLTSKATTSWPIALAIRYRAEAHLRLNKLEECLDDCHRSQDLFSHLEIGETIAPLAAQPHIVATVANMQMADYSSASEQWASAIQLINRHKGASNYFQPTLRRIASEMVARHACEHLNLLKRMPY
jgi:tetratricopeptide (TPR) repeat protein